MDRAPIPPHERSWRHPSELVPSAPSVETGSSRRRVLVSATCAVAATFVVGLVVLALPGRNPAPVAVSATTLPAFSLSSADATGAAPTNNVATEQVRLARAAIANPAGLALTGAPRSVAAPIDSQVPDPGSEAEPHDDAVVHLITSSHVYRLRHHELEWIIAPDGTLVVDEQGRVIGSFVDGRFAAD